jgi:hypothetical protein
MPTTIMLIRHAEKPTAPPPHGVDENGADDKNSLIVRGWQRAGALVPFFRTPWVQGIRIPTVIYAAGTSDQPLMIDGEDEAKSLRAVQTVTPLAQALALNVQKQYLVGQEDLLVQAIEKETGVVLVAWEHKHIPLIAQKLSAAAPDAWPGKDVFALVWVFNASNGGYSFMSIAQDLLAGDSG